MASFLQDIGFKPCLYDPGLFIYQTKHHLYLTSHVDDCKIAASHPADTQWVVDQLASQFDIKDLGQIHTYLGT